MKKLLIIFIALFTVLLVGCAKTNDTEVFRFETSEAEVKVGEQKELDLIMGSFDSKDLVFFASTNPLTEVSTSIFEIVSNEKNMVIIKALQKGEGYLQAKVKNTNAVDAMKIVVSEERIDYIKVTAEKDNIYIGETSKLTSVYSPSNENINIVYKSSNEKIATVDKDGVVTGVGAGTTTIKVYNEKDELFYGTKAISVKYYETSSIEIKGEGVTYDDAKNKYVVSIEAGTPFQIEAVAYGKDNSTDGVNQTFNYSTTKTNILNVSSTGLVTCKTNPSGSIDIKIESKARETNVKLSITYLTKSEIKENEVGLVLGTEIKLADLFFIKGIKGELISGDDVIGFTSTSNDKIKALAVGEAIIKLTYGGSTKDVKFVVKDFNSTIMNISALTMNDYAGDDYKYSVAFAVESIDDSNDYEVSIDNADVATVEKTDKGFDITLISTGKFDLTIKSGIVSKVITVTVK